MVGTWSPENRRYPPCRRAVEPPFDSVQAFARVDHQYQSRWLRLKDGKSIRSQRMMSSQLMSWSHHIVPWGCGCCWKPLDFWWVVHGFSMLLLEWARWLKANINIPLQGVRDDHSLKEVKRPCYTSDVGIFLQSGWGQHLANDTEGFFSNGKTTTFPLPPLPTLVSTKVLKRWKMPRNEFADSCLVMLG